MIKQNPIERVKREFQSKEDLVDRLVDRLERGEDETTEDFRTRLRTVSNRKLLRLWDIANRLDAEFGNKEALVDALVGLKFTHGRGDADYRKKLMTHKASRLLDLHDSLSKRAARS